MGAPNGTYPGALPVFGNGSNAVNNTGLVYQCPVTPGPCGPVQGNGTGNDIRFFDPEGQYTHTHTHYIYTTHTQHTLRILHTIAVFFTPSVIHTHTHTHTHTHAHSPSLFLSIIDSTYRLLLYTLPSLPLPSLYPPGNSRQQVGAESQQSENKEGQFMGATITSTGYHILVMYIHEYSILLAIKDKKEDEKEPIAHPPYMLLFPT